VTGWQWTLWSAGLLACVLTCVWALFWDQHRGRMRCPKCWYDMLGSAGRTCPECGYVTRHDRDWRRTRRRWKMGSVALLAAACIAVAPFGKTLLIHNVKRLPSTVLILIHGRISTDDPQYAWAFQNELPTRLQESPALCVDRWNRDALWRWQWKLLASRDEPDMAYLQSVAEVFAQAPPAQVPIVTHEDMLSLDHDADGKRFGALLQRIQWPADTFVAGYESQLSVKWLDVSATDGAPARIYLISSFQRFWLVATRQAGGAWRFAGAYNIWSKYADPDIRRLEDDETTFELHSISTGGTGTWTGAAAWCQIDERGLHVIHDWVTGHEENYSHAAFNYEFSTSNPVMGRDDRGAFIEQTLTVTYTNGDVSWDESECEPADVAAVLDVLDVFTRSGRTRYRRDATDHRYLLSPDESDWTAAQSRGWLDGDESFITQNFDTLVGFATGDDPAKRAWVRLMLTRLDDCTEKTRVSRAIAERNRR